MKIDFTDLIINIGTVFWEGLYRLGDKLEDVAYNMEFDLGDLETVPTKIVEKKRKTKKLMRAFLTHDSLKNLNRWKGK